MGKERLTAFTDGVVAIVITIMVLELRVPAGPTSGDLLRGLPVLATYVLSFLYVAIYWNNHHHLLQAVRSVTGGVLWANMHLLFWLSLTPFATAWMGQNALQPVPVATYGGVLIMNGVAYTMLTITLVRHEGRESLLAQAIGRDLKGWGSLAAYALAIALAFRAPAASMAIYAMVALVWLIPDRRVERVLRG